MGNPCTRCGLWSSNHRKRGQRNTEYDRQYNKTHPRANPSARIIGIDGEGQGRGPHVYNYLAAADEYGAAWNVRAEDGQRLKTRDCLDFILELPSRSLIFGYAFLYDLTKILTDLSNEKLYKLFHEKTRARAIPTKGDSWRITYQPIRWHNYKLNFMNRRFSVERHAVSCPSVQPKKKGQGRKHRRCNCGEVRRATVWDVFAFFQSKFVDTLIKWTIAPEAKLAHMREMKDARSKFLDLPRAVIEAYCNEECSYLAQLGRALIDAHVEAGLPLTQYYGAGSTASALLKKMDVLKYRGEFPIAMRTPLACAFFGGRFENSIVGEVPGPVWNYDISSAYPYQATLLPCLACGKWEFVKGKTLERRIKVSSLALINWAISLIPSTIRLIPLAWGLFPVRDPKGTIAFPSSGSGWTWKQEYLVARKLNSNIEVKGAWVYDTDCEHRPFGTLPETYRERIRWGKDAKGIVLKLGPNSVYGKVAQSRGLNPPFQSWIWAGNITSGTRAQLLESLIAAKDPWNILMFATDGVWSRERLVLPEPLDTGTSDLDKPLGGWEEKRFDRGVFAVRPGIYFPLSPTEEQKEQVRARGLGKRVLYDKCDEIVAAFKGGAQEIEVAGIDRFVGAKLGVLWNGGKGYRRKPDYGEWINHKITVTFAPQPKRERVLSDGRLQVWGHKPPSVPYKKSLESYDALALIEAQTIAEEQPDAEFAYEDFTEKTT